MSISDETETGASGAGEAGLEALRGQVAEIDRALLEALAERRKLSLEIGQEKWRSGLAIRNTDVERKGLVSLIRTGHDMGLDAHLVTRLFQSIIEDSVLLQQGHLQHESDAASEKPRASRVAFLGGAGSYSQAAAQTYFGRRPGGLIEVGCETFQDAVRKTESGEADFAVLPIENTTAGGMTEVYDLLQHTGLSIVGEVTRKIEHCLLASDPDIGPDAIRVLFVHPQVYGQCSHFLSQLSRARVVYCESTSHALEKASAGGEEAAAAIAGPEAGALWGLHVIDSDLANQRQSHTRFAVIARQPARVPRGVPAKTTILLSVDQKAGALVDALLAFREHGITMHKLESRPQPDNPWEAVFHIDFAGNVRDEPVAEALDKIARRSRFLKVLGCYPTEQVTPTDVPVDVLRRDEREAFGPSAASTPQAPASTPEVVPSMAAETVEAAAPAADEAPPKGWKLASRRYKTEDTIIQIGQAAIGGDGFLVMAGPCSVESEEQVMTAARHVREQGGLMLRGGCFKPRTNPYSFQGMGSEGLKLLRQAGDRYGLPIVTEVLASEQVAEVAATADMLQIGARNMQNFPLLRAVGRTHVPVLLKRGMMSSIDELLQAAEYILSEGNRQVVLCERGIRTFESATRNTLDLSAVPVLRERSHLPVIVDPSHAVGRRDLVAPMARAAKAVGAHGIIVEMHPRPEEALSDKEQALSPALFAEMMASLDLGARRNAA